MKNRHIAMVAGIIVFFFVAAFGFAHKPVESVVVPNDFEKALVIEQPEVSQVYYAKLIPGKPQVWLTFMGTSGESIYLSVGVPRIDRLKLLQPEIAILGVGFDELDLQFRTPTNTGRKYSPGARPRDFHEPVTGTDSWIYIETSVILPADGRFYVVAYVDEPLPSDPKLWVSIGTEERFSLADVLRLGKTRREVREFHEVAVLGRRVKT